MNGAFSSVTKPSLERIGTLLTRLGRPDRTLKFIHVAGTNGKGSTCAFIEAGLIAAGLRVGKFTSPNLVYVNERIALNGKSIDDASLESALGSATRAAQGLDATLFELWTAAAMLYFAEMKCEIVVLEVGLGGEFDATNIIDPPKLALICHIDFDHMKYLGNTLESIAAAKCGIIKRGTERVISSPQYPQVTDVIRAACAARGLPLTISEVPAPKDFEFIYERLSYRGIEARLSLGGVCQLTNACTAVDALIAFGIDKKSIGKGLESAKNPGRFEYIGENLIFDGAHNPDGIRALTGSLCRYFPGRVIDIIFACMKDKTVAPSLSMLAKLGGDFTFTTVADNPRAMDANALAALAIRECNIVGKSADSLADALAAADPSRLTVICGSLYLYKELRR